MDNLIRIENIKEQLKDLHTKVILKLYDTEGDKYELEQEIKILEREIERLEQEDVDGDNIILSVR